MAIILSSGLPLPAERKTNFLLVYLLLLLMPTPNNLVLDRSDLFVVWFSVCHESEASYIFVF